MRVLISGAGIAGPTLAFFLARTGARIHVLEKSASLLPHGQNVDITGSAIAIVRKMGLLDELRRWNTREKGTHFVDPSGKPFAYFPATYGARGPSMTSEFEILRSDLAKVLYEATKEDANITYSLGTTITDVIANKDQSVTVQLSNGQREEYDLLVAADGQWSRIRKMCFPPESITVVDKGMYAVYFTIPRLPADDDWWNVYNAIGSKIITIRPDPHGTVRAMFTHMPSNDNQKNIWERAARSDRKVQQDLIRQEFSDAGWQARRILDAMDQAPDFYFQPLKQIKMSKWHTGRVVCLGDAAFAPTPLSGIGTSLAIDGAYALAGELSKLADQEHPSAALEAYEKVFRPFVEEMQPAPSWIAAAFHPNTGLTRWIFQSLISTFSRIVAIPWVRNKFTEEDREDFKLPQYSRLDAASLDKRSR